MKNPRSILITGASSGIGAALARHYAAPGVTLHLGGRDQARLEAVAADCAALGAACLPQVLDVTERGAMAAWIAAADEAAPLDLVIANAGIGESRHDGTMSDIAERTFAVNVGGVFHTVHPAAERMAARRRGQIAVISSLAGYQGLASTPAYSASKAAVKAYAEALRGLLESEGVEVSVVCPGFVVSGITARNDFRMPFLMSAERAARIIARGLAANRGRIVFPWQLMLGVRVLVNLPMPAIDWLMRRAPRK
ncbi:MAG: SDR family NAD(P)-dependent oxidoreductase [Alphaproteobacteria bacterium]|nr:SDR family NAD(P)-dependent oxidoreductase [Alphaproteobacteria bacterium]